MKNIYIDAINKKEQLHLSISEKTPYFYKYKQIFEKGNVVFLSENFDFKNFIRSINFYLKSDLKLKTTINDYNNTLIEIKYKSESSFASKIHVDVDFILLFQKIENILLFNIDISEAFEHVNENKSKFSFTSLINDPFKKEISISIFEIIYNSYISQNLERKLNFNSSFIEHTHLNERIFIENISKNDSVLAKLNISGIKTEDPDINSQIYISSFIVTDNSIATIAFNKQGELIVFEEITENIKLKKGLTSNTVSSQNISWNTKRSNSKLFNQLKEIQSVKGNKRIQEFARLNYLAKNFKYTETLISKLRKKDDNPINGFLFLLANIKKNETLSIKNIPENNIKNIIHELLSSKKIDKDIVEILNKWGITNIEKTLLLELFTENADTENENKAIIPLFETIRTEFKKKNKDLINQTVFEINYTEFLISSGKKRKAVSILKKLLKHLPNETISDILPSKSLDITSNKSGQLLKIKILDLLTQAKGKDKSEEEIAHSVILQPLNTNTLNLLANTKNEDLKQKAVEIISLLNKNGLNLVSKEVPVKKHNTLPLEAIEKEFRHPATLEKGSFYSIQKWISKIKMDDYSAVKEYAERIEASNYPKLNEIFYNLQQIFSIPELEFYISRGDKSHQIIGYEGKPPFVIIGHNHIDKESDLFLNFKELQFAVASELAHIYFKHSKISSNDVWRGVADKGSLLLDAVLGIIPVAGLAGKSIQNAHKLSGLTNIISRSNQLSNGKNIYDAANRISSYYKENYKADSKTKKKQKLLAASRLMQHTADRAGLAISGDIKSAVRAVFLTGKYNHVHFNEAKETSLREFILKTNSDETYKNQEIALRVAHLFSFYISDSYTKVRSILMEEKK